MQRFGCGWGLVEQGSELVADGACLGVAVVPLVGVDAQGGVGFAVAEAVLDVDEVVVECDQHAGVAVAEVVQGRVGGGELGGLGGAFECVAGGLAFEAGAVAAREHERVRVEEAAAVGDEVEQARMSSGGMSIARRDSAVLSGVRVPSRPSWYSTRMIECFRVEVADGEAERFADPQPAGEQQFEQAAVLVAVGVRRAGLAFLRG